jgi:DNA-binding transcriptional LysR family regulator
MLSTRILTQFVAVAEELNFRRAAQRLHMEQSPLSQAIRRLEQQLDERLFTRTKRSVALTAAGDLLLQHARSALKAEHSTLALLRRARESGSGQLAVGFVGTVAYGIVPRLLRDFRHAQPAVHLEIAEMTTREQIKNLLGGQLDAGIMRLPIPEQAGLSSRTIESDRFGLAVPGTFGLTSRRSIGLRELRNASFVAYSHDRVPILHSHGVAMCLEEGFYPNIVCEAWQASSILSFVAAGIGVALVPLHLSELKHSGVAFRPLSPKSPNVQLDIAVVWRSDNPSHALQLFLDFIPS